MHVNVSDLSRKVDPACLPKELGGKIPMVEMIEWWKQELAAKRDTLLALDNMKILSDGSIISRNGPDRNNNERALGMETITGSFRKLEVD